MFAFIVTSVFYLFMFTLIGLIVFLIFDTVKSNIYIDVDEKIHNTFDDFSTGVIVFLIGVGALLIWPVVHVTTTLLRVMYGV